MDIGEEEKRTHKRTADLSAILIVNEILNFFPRFSIIAIGLEIELSEVSSLKT